MGGGSDLAVAAHHAEAPRARSGPAAGGGERSGNPARVAVAAVDRARRRRLVLLRRRRRRSHGPARRRWRIAHLRLGAPRRAPRDSRRSGRRPRAGRRPAPGRPRRPPERDPPRRLLGPRDLRRPQPNAPHEPRAPGGARAGAAIPGAGGAQPHRPRVRGRELPVRPPDPGDDRLRPFEAPEGAPPASYVELRPRRVERTVEREGAAGEIVYGVLSEGGQGRMEEIDLELEQSSVRRYRIQEHDPLTARAEVVQRMGLRRGPWAVAVESRVWLSATEEAFALRARLEAFEGDTLVCSRSWDCRVARDGL